MAKREEVDRTGEKRERGGRGVGEEGKEERGKGLRGGETLLFGDAIALLEGIALHDQVTPTCKFINQLINQ